MAELNEFELAKINEQTDRYQEGVQAERQRVLELIVDEDTANRFEIQPDWVGLDPSEENFAYNQQFLTAHARNALRQQMREAIAAGDKYKQAWVDSVSPKEGK